MTYETMTEGKIKERLSKLKKILDSGQSNVRIAQEYEELKVCLQIIERAKGNRYWFLI